MNKQAQEVTVNKKWMPITAGVLDIIIGFLGIYIGSIVAFAALAIPWLVYGSWVWFISGVLIFIGILAVVGGVYALKRKRWRLALAGTIVAFLSTILYMQEYWSSFYRSLGILYLFMGYSGIFSIAAVILIALSKKQFERK